VRDAQRARVLADGGLEKQAVSTFWWVWVPAERQGAREHCVRHVHKDEVLAGVGRQRRRRHDAPIPEVPAPAVPHRGVQEPLLPLRARCWLSCQCPHSLSCTSVLQRCAAYTH